MKKYIFSFIAVLCLTLVTFFGCNSKPKVSGEFSNEKYVMTIGENLNLINEIQLNGCEIDNISFYSSDLNVVNIENNQANAVGSGDAVLFAKYNDKTIATANVFVKFQFSVCDNIIVNEEGFISWTEPTIIYQGQTKSPEKYFIYIANVTDKSESEYNEVQFEKFETEYGYQLSSQGQYLVKIQTIEDEFSQSSQISESVLINYGVMGNISNITFEQVKENNSKEATLSWDKNSKAIYNVYIENFLVYESLTSSSFTYDFAKLSEGQDYAIKIVAIDKEGLLLPTTTTLKISTLNTCEISYKLSNSGNGVLVWDSVENAFGYNAIIKNQSGEIKYESYDLKGNIEQTFEGIGNGKFTISIVAKGGYRNGVCYLNSESSNEIDVLKLNKPNMNVSFDNNFANIEIDNDENNTYFELSYAGKTIYFEGNEKQIDLSGLKSGNYTFNLSALPTNEIISKNDNANILSSDTTTFDFFVLDKISNVSHNLSDDKVSTFTFKKIKNANVYEFYVNEDNIEGAMISEKNENIQIICDLSKISPVERKYEIKILAYNQEDGETKSSKVEYNLTLEILPVITPSDDQTNGIFTWNKIDNNYARYEYKITKYTDSSRLEVEKEFTVQTTKNNYTSESLEFGYYSIEVITKSSSYSSYFDSNFYSSNEGEGYLKSDFIVTKKIESPQLSFSCNTGKNVLTISGVEYGGGYDIYVDGQKDGSIENNSENQLTNIEYIFNNEFSEEKNYKIEVYAHSGSIFDGTLHTISDASIINIERLSKPTFSVTDSYDEITGAKTSELLTVNMIDNAKSVEIYLDSELVNHNNAVELINYEKFGSIFNLSFKFKAGVPNGSQYYMDSLDYIVKFERVQNVTDMYFDDGYLNFTTNDTRIEKYYITIELTTDGLGSSFYRFFTEANQIETIGANNFKINVQSIIDNLIIEDETFAQNYKNAKSVRFGMISYKNGFEDNVYFLPSFNGISMQAKEYVEVERLPNSSLSFDLETNELKWTEPVKNSKYSIYVDGTLYLSNLTQLTYDYFSCGIKDLTETHTFYIESENTKYLDGENSNTIYITRLKPIQRLTLSKDENDDYICIFYVNSTTLAKSVMVNDNLQNVNYNSNSPQGYISLKNFQYIENFYFEVIAKNSENNYYYVNSEETLFNIKNIANSEIVTEIDLQSNNLTWNNITPNIVTTENSSNPVKYRIEITNNEQDYIIETQNLTYSIEEFEKTLGVTFTGDLFVKITAEILDYSYLLESNETNFAYFGELSSSGLNIVKLSTPSSEITTIQKKDSVDLLLNSYVQFKISNTWKKEHNIENLIFNVTINKGLDNEKNIIIDTSQGNVSKDEVNNITFEIHEEYFLLNIFKENLPNDINFVEIFVQNTGSITSETSYSSVYRLKDIQNVEISNEGMLKIVNNIQTGDYIISQSDLKVFLQLKINGETIIKEISLLDENSQLVQEIEIDLMTDEYLNGKSGEYEIQLIFFDNNNKILPSSRSYLITGRKLQGIESLEIKDWGNINFVLFNEGLSDIVFVAKYNGVEKEFMPTIQLSNNVFEIGMIEVIELFNNEFNFTDGEYTFQFNVRNIGSINSDWINLTFNYQHEDTSESSNKVDGNKESSDSSQDYLIFYPYEDDNTIYFNVKVKNVLTGEISYQNFSADETKGYWFVSNDGKDYRFVKDKNVIDSDNLGTFTECYGISLNLILEEFEYGHFIVDISRIGKVLDNENYKFYQYNKLSYDLYKLNSIETQNINLSNNVFSWNWEKDNDFETPDNYKPTAYYVIVNEMKDATVDSEIIGTKKYKLYISSLDLINSSIVTIEEGKYYRISFVAVNEFYNNIISSNVTQYEYNLFRNSKPIDLTVQDGVISFDIDSFKNSDYMKSIETFFNTEGSTDLENNDYFKSSNQQIVTNPFAFNFSNLQSQNIVLRFTNYENQNQVYSLTIPAVHLFPDFNINNTHTDLGVGNGEKSYIDLLTAYKNTYYDTSSYKDSNLWTFINYLSKSNRGLGFDSIMFDDFGKQIPTGKYILDICHKGINQQTISSSYSNAITVYLTASPQIELSQPTQDKDYYYVNVKTSQFANTSNEKEMNNNYKMVFRLNYEESIKIYDENDLFELDIQYDGDNNWLLKYNGVLIENVITGYNSTSGDKYFEINMTLLRDKLGEILELNNKFKTNNLYRIDIYSVYQNFDTQNNNDVYYINGKSATFNINFLQLQGQNITFIDGNMQISIDYQNNDTNSILMKYKKNGSSENTKIFNLNFNSTEIELDSSGLYNYIILSLNGSISYNTMKVESKSYAIANLYKLTSPSVNVINNYLSITSNSNDIAYLKTLSFYLGNNISLDNNYLESDKGYYYNSLITSSNNSISYKVGALNQQGLLLYPSEIEASNFTLYSKGNSGTFIVNNEASDEEKFGADYLWTFTNIESVSNTNYVIFKSEETNINAKMLQVVKDVVVSQGQISWNLLEENLEGQQNLEEGAELIYQVDVGNYIITTESDGKQTYVLDSTTTYYTSETNLSYVNLSNNYNYFTFDVTTIAGKEVSQSYLGTKILTVEGKYYDIYNPVKYLSQDYYVLRDTTKSKGNGNNQQVIFRSETPNNSKILDGNIQFTINEEYKTDNDLVERLAVYVTWQNGSNRIKLEGSYKFEKTSEQTAGILVTFTPNENQINTNYSLTIEIYYYNEENLMSKPLIINNVQKLPNIAETYYNININDKGKTYIDFSEYFNNIKYSDDNTCYKINIREYTLNADEELILTKSQDILSTSDKQYELNAETIIKIQVQDAQGSDVSNKKLLLYSDTLTFDIKETITSEDNYELSIKWNANYNKFDFIWKNKESSDNEFLENFEFYYYLNIGGTIDKGITRNNYYMPKTTGNISLKSFYIRARNLNINNNELYIFSEPIFNNEEVSNSLFAGNGSSVSPYQIKTADDFYNIYKRNSENERYYYQLTNNIVLDIDRIISINEEYDMNLTTFYGYLDGNNKTITLNANKLIDMKSSYQKNMQGVGSVEFNKYFALFYSIDSQATIKNLNLSLNLNLKLDQETKAIISSLALYNYGNLSNVTISNLSNQSLNSSASTTSNIFIGGIVGINLGTILDCKDATNFEINVSKNIYLGYAGICVFNDSIEGNIGQIIGAISRGDKKIIVNSNNATVLLSGLTTNNYSLISSSGNESNLTIASSAGITGFTAFISGITITSENATLNYVYNSGLLTKDNSVPSSATIYTSAISYIVVDGYINTLIDVTSNALVLSCTIAPDILGQNYASQNSGTHTNIPTTSLKDVKLVTDFNYDLSIISIGDNYTVTISKK